jgi:AraC-like DNA-binding protein
MVAWCEIRSLSSRQLLELASLSITDLLFRDITDSRHTLAQILSSAVQRTSARQLDSRLSSILPDSIRPLFVMGLERASEPLDVERAAAAFGVTRRTLRNRLVYHGLPRPQSFLVWCRLLVAGTLLDERGRTLDSVALQLNFSTGQNLGAALRRYVGATITSLRQGDVGPTVEAEFRRIVVRGRARATATRKKRTADSLPAPSSAD